MRIPFGFVYALAAVLIGLPAQQAAAYDVLASTLLISAGISPDDPDPTLNGIIRINTETGAVTPFINEGTGGALFAISDVAVGPHDGLIYASTQVGSIERFDASGNHVDQFAIFATIDEEGEPTGDRVNRLAFTTDGGLFATTASGRVASFTPTGSPNADLATGLTFPAGIAISPDEQEVYVATGEVGGPGAVVRLDPGGPTTIIENVIGGASGLTFRAAVGDYNGDDTNDASDYTAWQAAYGSADSPADGNGDGVVDAADYTLWRDNPGDNAELLVNDFDFGFVPGQGNRIYAYDLVAESGSTLTTIPVALPDPLEPPPTAFPTNFPSEVLILPNGELLVSNVGPSQRPLNRGSLLRFGADGTLLDTIATSLPPLSGIALAPAIPVTVPEPGSAWLLVFTSVLAIARNRR